MSVWKTLVMVISAAALLACLPEEETDPPPRFDVTLEPSQIAVNFYTPPPHPFQMQAALVDPTDAPTSTATAAQPATLAPTRTPTVPAAPLASPDWEPVPASNHAELRAMQDSEMLRIGVEISKNCFLAGEAVPFQLTAQNLDSESIYFYLNGAWLFSINNSPPGPQLPAVRAGSAEDFLELGPNLTYLQQERDLGLWVLALGPGSGIPFTATGTGLPAGHYWVTFIYSSDQDGSDFVPTPAWTGTAVSFEMRFTVVNDQSEC